MSASMATGGSPGEDLVCRSCGCEVMVKHWGEPRSSADSGTFTCHCGQRMEPEHPSQGGEPRRGEGQRQDGDHFDQEDFLGQGGGAGETTGVGHASTSSGRGGR